MIWNQAAAAAAARNQRDLESLNQIPTPAAAARKQQQVQNQIGERDM